MSEDKKVLRGLAERFREIAFSDKNDRKRALHAAVNDLKMKRPIVLIDELPWGELNAEHELDLHCEDPYLRQIEQYLRQMLYRHDHFPADMIFPRAIPVTKVIHSSGFGLDVKEDLLPTDPTNQVVSHRFYDQMQDESCLEKIHNVNIVYDREESERRYELVSDAVGDIMPVNLVGDQWCFDELWDVVAKLHGVGQVLEDLLERPEYMHAIAEKLTDVFLDKVRQYEELNLFQGFQESVHCTSALTHDLPGKDCDGVHFRAKDVWGRGMAQIFVSVSPAMRKEFDLPYMSRAMEPFGLVYYGCCEPLHNQIENISRIPNLRKITVTPWADYSLAAEQIGKKYVYSAKASPANIALGRFDDEVIRRELGRITDACCRNGCNFELILKDVSTVSYHPEVLHRWEQIAREFIPEEE